MSSVDRNIRDEKKMKQISCSTQSSNLVEMSQSLLEKTSSVEDTLKGLFKTPNTKSKLKLPSTKKRFHSIINYIQYIYTYVCQYFKAFDHDTTMICSSWFVIHALVYGCKQYL